jgi:hypothetical protein
LEQLSEKKPLHHFKSKTLTKSIHMTHQSDRLDRIEAALDRQLEVNAEVRTSVVELRATAEALLQAVQIHQQNFEVIVGEIRQMQSDIRGLQTENRRIWERLERQDQE